MQRMSSMPGSTPGPVSSKLRRSEPTGGAGLLCLALFVASLVLFTVSVREGEVGPLHTVRDVTQTIVSPFRMLGAAVVSPFAGLSNVMRNLTADEQTLSELKEENRRLNARNVELEEAELTAQRLQALLELQSTYNLQSKAASVISGAQDSWSATVTIDKGAASGLSVGMPVVDANGAVGQVIACAGTTSTVRLLTDEGSSVSAMVQSSRAQGMLEGSVDGTLRLAYIRTDQTINVGDIVVTSGLGGVFPKGLPLGRVSIVESAPGSSYYDIVVEPFAYPGLLEEVLVVTSLTEGQEATAEDIAIADAADVAAAGGTPREVVTEGEPSEGADNGVEEGAAWDEGLGYDDQAGAADTGSDEQAQGTGLSVSVRDVSTGAADEGEGAADADQ